MAQPIDVRSRIDLPDTGAAVTIMLVERGAAHLAYGIGLLFGNNLVRHLVTWPEDETKQKYPLETQLPFAG